METVLKNANEIYNLGPIPNNIASGTVSTLSMKLYLGTIPNIIYDGGTRREIRPLHGQYPDWIFYFVIKLVKNAQSGFDSRTEVLPALLRSHKMKKHLRYKCFFILCERRESNPDPILGKD